MLNIVQRSQISGLMAIDGFGISNLGKIEDVWLDETGKVAYISASAGYIPLEQVADISDIGLATYGELVVDVIENIQPLYRLAVGSTEGEPLGWIEDFLFDWRTGEIAAYILTGIAPSLGESALLSPEDVEQVTLDCVIVREGTKERLKPKSEGLKGFFSDKYQQAENLMQGMGDRVHQLLDRQDEAKAVRVKVKQVDGDRHPRSDRWDTLRHNVSHSLNQVKSGWDSTWQHLTGKSE